MYCRGAVRISEYSESQIPDWRENARRKSESKYRYSNIRALCSANRIVFTGDLASVGPPRDRVRSVVTLDNLPGGTDLDPHSFRTCKSPSAICGRIHVSYFA